jgi:2-oxo-4-hydroxy-4-carboxy-5-ureidoimidazoline decarboxylase
MTLEELNGLSEPDAREALARCCGASRWVAGMVAARPFADRDALFAAAERAASALAREDWLEAFSHHPKIGDVKALREKFAATAAWAGREQSGAASASEVTLAALSEGNRAYAERFGYIFIVFATGKSAADMLSILESRLPNPPEVELKCAAAEQRKITALRLQKLVGETT